MAKALYLAYEYANLLQSVKILTDLRPVFNEGGDDIDGAVVSYTLRLYYDNPEGNHSLSVAFDEQDIQNLHKECERALTKAKTVKRMVEQGMAKPVMIAGEDNDATS